MKSLFLAQAILIAATVDLAAASEPVYVEPEPQEQMKPCDMYGPGWYYLPGTTTCVKIDGDVRIDYSSRRSHRGN